MGELAGAFTFSLIALSLIVSVMAILTPFFVYRIRCEMIEMNKKADIALRLIAKRLPPEPHKPPERPKNVMI